VSAWPSSMHIVVCPFVCNSGVDFLSHEMYSSTMLEALSSYKILSAVLAVALSSSLRLYQSSVMYLCVVGWVPAMIYSSCLCSWWFRWLKMYARSTDIQGVTGLCDLFFSFIFRLLPLNIYICLLH
jgi:hypothetical protein